MRTTAEEHFENGEKIHTQIKHKLFKSALDASLSIANALNYKDKENIPFMYIDLYAGAGKFSDEKEGSPLIALNSISKYNEKKSFSSFEIVVSENNQINADNLNKNIADKKNALNISDEDCKCNLYCCKWEECINDLTQCIKARKWGFVFVDPFSLELNLKELMDLLNHNIYYKDVMILINKNAQERVLGKPDNPDIQKICNYFGIKEDVLKRLIAFVKTTKGGTNEDVIQLLTQKVLGDVDKDYKIYAGISRTRQGELENADRFYLALITSSLGVANNFLETYSDLLEEKELKDNSGQQNIFDTSNTTKYINLEQKILQHLSNQTSLSLYELTKCLFNVFLSWKYTEDNEIPHRKALIITLNNLLQQKKIEMRTDINLPKSCINMEKNTILSKSFSAKENLKKIQIKIL